MNTEKNKEKRIYVCPEIICIELDNEIALALESNPPEGPNEGFSSVEHSFNNNPYNNFS